MESEQDMTTVEGEIISSFELGIIIDDVDFRHFYLKNGESKVCVVVTPDCPDFQSCIDELFYKLHNKKHAIVTGTQKNFKDVECAYGIIADSVKIENK